MANYTPNYRLHQWLPEDKFLRTDFNEDFSTIDAALGKTERSARRAVAGLERQGSDLYNLLLQNDYEGKTTGWKRALVFDGFQDGAGIAQKDEALILGRNCLSLHRTGLNDIDLGYGGDGSYHMSARVTCTSGGWTTGFRLRLRNTGTVIDTTRVKTSLTRNGAACFSGRETTGSYLPEKETEEVEISFPASYEVKEGDRLELTAEIVSKSWSLTNSAKSGNQLGGIFRFTPNGANRGTMIFIPRPMPGAGALHREQ